MDFTKKTWKTSHVIRSLYVVQVVTFCMGLLIVTSSLFGQTEEHLKIFFEGKMVMVKMDMPATKEGIDVYPQKSQPVKYSEYGERLKKYGTALSPGDRVMITKIKTKKKHIEFQLGGGGYGTFGDESGIVNTPYLGKSEREKNLKKEIENDSDPEKKKAMQEELDDLRREREKEQIRLQMEAEQARAAKQETIRPKVLQAGSRFNIRYSSNLTSKEKTVESVMAALSEFVEFSPESFNGVAEAVDDEEYQFPKPAATGTLRKGLLWEEVAAMMGAPSSVTERMEGNLKVMSCTFTKNQQKIETEFVEGVLIRYTISSK